VPTPVPTVVPVTPVLPGIPATPTDGAWNVYVVTITTTVTTTTVTAPITVIAAPVTTTTTSNNSNTTNTNSSSSTTAAGAPATKPATSVTATGKRAELNINLQGCTAKGTPGRSRAQLRLPRGTTLVVRVNGHRVGTLELDSAKRRTLPLRLRLRQDGTLTVRRPSGRVLAIQGCSAR
jgi:hypothetical protein